MSTGEINQALDGFLGDLVALVQEKYDESLAGSNSVAAESEVAFQRGLSFAYYDALDLIRSQLLAFGYEDAAAKVVVPEFGQPISSAA